MGKNPGSSELTTPVVATAGGPGGPGFPRSPVNIINALSTSKKRLLI